MEKLSRQRIKKTSSVAGALIILSLFSFTCKVNAQYSLLNDTLKIQEVIIPRKQISSEQPGFKFYSIDSMRLKDFNLSSLTDVLNENTFLYMKNYGMGGTATSSFRGTLAGHTQVAWNGININDPMVGQSDFSLIPSGFVENVMVSFGGASMDIGNGAIGGIISLENEPVWKKRSLVEASAGTGSLRQFSELLKVSTGSERFQSVTKGYLSSSANEFKYLDVNTIPEPLWKKRENNQVHQKGFMQELYYRKSKNILSARFWYESATRNLPGSTLYGYSGEKQADESFRSLLNYDFVKGKGEFFSSAALLITNLDYSSELYSINSVNTVRTLVLKGGVTIPLREYSRIKIVLSNEGNNVESNNYSNNINRNNTSITLSAERKKGRRLGAVVLLREILDGKSLLIPDYSAGFEYRIFRGEEHYLKFNMSRNSKIPSLNDLFWNPGGNPNLKNEYAYSYEIGYRLNHQIFQSVTISSEFNLFNNLIRDMIQWRPGESYFWVADNIGSVNSSGLESLLSAKYVVNAFSLNLNLGYSHTKAEEKNSSSSESAGKQLIYIPKNQINSTLHVGYKNLYAIFGTNYTGRTYTTSNNSVFLKGYTKNNISTGMKFNISGNFIDLRLKIENVFDVSYKTIAYYPQPGRTYLLTVSLQFKK